MGIIVIVVDLKSPPGENKIIKMILLAFYSHLLFLKLATRNFALLHDFLGECANFSVP